MPKKLIAIGTTFPHSQVEFKSISSQVSLLDYDISIFNPDIGFLLTYPIHYKGKPSLDDTNSFKLKEQLSHWRREILEAVRAGKTVFLLLNSLQEVYVATGEKTYSGTGRNRQTTRLVTLYSNYNIIPEGIDVVNSNGTSMILYGHDNFLTTYWAELQSVSEFRVFISDEGLKPLVITKTGNKIVGACLKYKDAQGTLVLLPYIDFDRDNFTRTTRSGNLRWTDEAIQVGKQFFSSIVGTDSLLKEDREFTPAPNWLTQDRFILVKEQSIRNKLLTLDTNIETIYEEKEHLQQVLAAETEIKGLLYEKGKPLETAILKSLKLIGFDATQYRDSGSEFDVVFESKEGRLIGEAEGKDNRAINIDKLRQLAMNIHEDFARDEVSDMAKGVLIGNAYRLSPPEDREDCFTEKCLTAAKRNNIALIRTTDLFYVSRYLSSKVDKLFSRKCRKAIIESVGVVIFPDIPDSEPSAPERVVIRQSD